MKTQEKIEINGKFYPYTRDLTPEEELDMPEVSKEDRIAELKQALLDTDYKAIKYAEGWLTEEEYEPIKVQRQVWRDEINALEAEIVKQ